jgi:hypothetical protein
MVDAKTQTSFFLKCQHCDNKAPMSILSSYHLNTTPAIDEEAYLRLNDYDEEGYDYELLLCTVCKKKLLY